MIELIPAWSYSVIFVWFAWRLWLFTLRPLLYPQEVKVLPYTIPFIGHTIRLFRGPYALYASAQKYYANTKIPYILHILGGRIVVVSDPQQITSILSDNDNYTYDTFLDLVYRHVGKLSDEAQKLLWRTPDQGFRSLHPNPKNYVLAHTGKKLLHKQFLTKQPFEALVQKVLVFIERGCRWENLAEPALLASDNETKVLSLHHFVRDVMVMGEAHAFFGPLLLDIAPNFTEIFDQWDKNSWRITYRYPDFLARPAIEAREKLVEICKTFLDRSGDECEENVALVRELTEENRHGGLSNEDCARILMIIMWAINSNVQLATFWMMAYILRDRELYSAIRKEIDPVMANIDSSIDLDPAQIRDACRTKLVEGCPLLNSTFDEVMRLSFTGMFFRTTTKTVNIGGREIPPNESIYMPQRQLLIDQDVFGPDAETFDAERFLQNKRLLRNESYRPFGGGTTLCVGKAAARYEMLLFVAWVVWRYEMKIVAPGEQVLGVDGMAFPRMDFERLSFGITKQIEGDNLIVQIRQRVR